MMDIETLNVSLPRPSIGSTNSRIGVCLDLIDASFVAEANAACAASVKAVHD